MAIVNSFTEMQEFSDGLYTLCIYQTGSSLSMLYEPVENIKIGDKFLQFELHNSVYFVKLDNIDMFYFEKYSEDERGNNDHSNP